MAALGETLVGRMLGSRELPDRVLAALSSTPGRLRRPALRAGAAAARWRVRRRGNPARLLFHVTHRCDAHCEHCFLHGEGRTVEGNTLSRDEVRALTATMPDRVRMLTFAGGEPTLRGDLAELAAAFRDGPGVDRVSVVTHGGFPARVEKLARALLAAGVPAVRFQVSLDAVGAEHDRIRQKPGLYDAALETLARLKRLDDPRLDPPQVLTTVGRHNLDTLGDVLEAVAALDVVHKLGLYRDPAQGVFGVPAVALAGPPERRSSLTLAGLDPARVAAVVTDARARIAARERHGPGSSRAERLHDALFLEMQLAALLGGERQVACVARWVDGVLLPDGGLAFCEESAPFANVRDVGLDFQAAWRGEAAQARRAQLAACHCAHPCHLSSSMAFDAASVEAVVARGQRGR